MHQKTLLLALFSLIGLSCGREADLPAPVEAATVSQAADLAAYDQVDLPSGARLKLYGLTYDPVAKTMQFDFFLARLSTGDRRDLHSVGVTSNDFLTSRTITNEFTRHFEIFRYPNSLILKTDRLLFTANNPTQTDFKFKYKLGGQETPQTWTQVKVYVVWDDETRHEFIFTRQ